MLKFISLILFINVLWHGQHGKAPTKDLDEDEIFYFIDPMRNCREGIEEG